MQTGTDTEFLGRGYGRDISGAFDFIQFSRSMKRNGFSNLAYISIARCQISLRARRNRTTRYGNLRIAQ